MTITNPLDVYSNQFARYQGQLVLEHPNLQALQFQFEAVQLEDGRIYVWCTRVDDIEKVIALNSTFRDIYNAGGQFLEVTGTTSDGATIYMPSLQLEQFGYERESDSTNLVFGADTFTVIHSATAETAQLQFGITNFVFEPFEPAVIDERQILVLPISLERSAQQTLVQFWRRSDYKDVKEIMIASSDIRVTGMARVSMSNPGQNYFQVVEDICSLLSIAKGCLINWIFCIHQDSEGNIIKIEHHNRVTKPYGLVSVIDHKRGDLREIKNFVETTYDTYVEKRESYKLDTGAIHSYLAAKSTGDLLESRGVKVAVAIEMLKDLFLKNFPEIQQLILPEEDFGVLQAEIESLIDKHPMSEVQRGEMKNKILELNRRSFATILKAFIEKIDLKVDKKDVRRFIAFRNSLVHTGQFYSKVASDKEKRKLPPLPSVQAEYFFLVNFLDRLLLRLLDYNGPYIDRSTPIFSGTYKDSVN